jgi:hypothetical protein
MVEMRIDVRSFHQALLLRFLATALLLTGKHGSSAFLGPRPLNRYQLFLFSTTGVCYVYKELNNKTTPTHNVRDTRANPLALLKAIILVS